MHDSTDLNPRRPWAYITTANGLRAWKALQRPDLTDDRVRGPDGKVTCNGAHGPNYATAKRVAKREAEKAKRFKHVGREQAYVTDPKLKLEDPEGQWFEYLDVLVRAKEMADGTARLYKQAWNQRVKPYLGKYPITAEAISPDVINKWLLKLKETDHTESYPKGAFDALLRLLDDARITDPAGWEAYVGRPPELEALTWANLDLVRGTITIAKRSDRKKVGRARRGGR